MLPVSELPLALPSEDTMQQIELACAITLHILSQSGR